MDLFTQNEQALAPLADRMRPRTLDDFVGQQHLLGPGKLLRRAILADRVGSCLFYGPPGTGKTSLAAVISERGNAAFEKLNAVTSGVAELREAVARAAERQRLYARRTYLLLDECHRWSKAQSDALLPAIEKGTLTFIGSTTENPNIAMTPAILSRVRVYEFLPLTPMDITLALRAALENKERGLGNLRIALLPEAESFLAENAGGDLRAALNGLELAVLTTPPDANNEITVTLEAARESFQRPAIRCDQTTFYDMLSAFCKSLRGSNPDAALFWASRMVQAGVDPRTVARRLWVHASEDVGLADPMAMLQAQGAYLAVEKLGPPECLIPLSQAILYVCLAPKSNSALAIHAAMADAVSPAEVPLSLRDANYNGGTVQNGKGYLYPHDYPAHWVEQQYLPDTLQGKTYYTPGELGREAELYARYEEARGKSAEKQTKKPEGTK